MILLLRYVYDFLFKNKYFNVVILKAFFELQLHKHGLFKNIIITM